MTAVPDLLDNVLALLSGIGALRQRKMFGGIYIYCDDLFIATVHDGTLYFKANKATAHEFLDRGLRPFTYSRQGEATSLQYYEAPAEVVGCRSEMQRWAGKALDAARHDASLKKPRKGGAR